MKEARIRTEFGEFCIQFETPDELHTALQNLEQEIKAVQDAASS